MNNNNELYATDATAIYEYINKDGLKKTIAKPINANGESVGLFVRQIRKSLKDETIKPETIIIAINWNE